MAGRILFLSGISQDVAASSPSALGAIEGSYFPSSVFQARVFAPGGLFFV